MWDLLDNPYVLLAIPVLIVAAYLYYLVRRRRKAINAILLDPNPLAEWTYSPDEWRHAVEELSWGGAKDGPTQIRISRTGILFRNSKRQHLVPLDNGTRVVTHAGYLGGDTPLKLRTRWREILRDRYGRQQIKYLKEDIRIPVPLREKAAAENVVNFFTNWIANNMESYTQMISDDEPISLFGRDSF